MGIYTMLRPTWWILLQVAHIAHIAHSFPAEKQGGKDDVEELPTQMKEILQVSDITPEELVGLLVERQDVKQNISPGVGYDVEYDYHQLSTDQDSEMVIKLKHDDYLYYPDIHYDDPVKQNIDIENISEVENDGEVEDRQSPLFEKEKDNLPDYDYNVVDEYEVIVDLNPAETELDYEENMEDIKFVDVKSENIHQSRKMIEIALLSGMALITMIIMFGMMSLATSIMKSRLMSSTPPVVLPQVQMATPGGIIKQYTRIPVEIKNMLPSNVAYKQLYETQ